MFLLLDPKSDCIPFVLVKRRDLVTSRIDFPDDAETSPRVNSPSVINLAKSIETAEPAESVRPAEAGRARLTEQMRIPFT